MISLILAAEAAGLAKLGAGIGAGLAALEGLRLALSVLSSHVCPP